MYAFQPNEVKVVSTRSCQHSLAIFADRNLVRSHLLNYICYICKVCLVCFVFSLRLVYMTVFVARTMLLRCLLDGLEARG